MIPKKQIKSIHSSKMRKIKKSLKKNKEIKLSNIFIKYK